VATRTDLLVWNVRRRRAFKGLKTSSEEIVREARPTRTSDEEIGACGHGRTQRMQRTQKVRSWRKDRSARIEAPLSLRPLRSLRLLRSLCWIKTCTLQSLYRGFAVSFCRQEPAYNSECLPETQRTFSDIRTAACCCCCCCCRGWASFVDDDDTGCSGGMTIPWQRRHHTRLITTTTVRNRQTPTPAITTTHW